MIISARWYAAAMYLYEHDNWTHFTWSDAVLLPIMGEVRFAQGELLGKISGAGLGSDAGKVSGLMDEFIVWFNECDQDPLMKAGIAHLWFLAVHPFDDGNGRTARALTDLLLTRSDQRPRRYYSMARYILDHRDSYYRALEAAQKGSSDITEWLAWFFEAMKGSIDYAGRAVEKTLERETFWRALENVSLNDRQRKMLFRLKGDFEGKLTASKWAVTTYQLSVA